MKKIIYYLLTISALLLLLTCCKSNDNDTCVTTEEIIEYTDITDSEKDVPCSHIWTSDSCSDVRKCSLCGYSDGQIMGHTWLKSLGETTATCVLPGRTVYYCKCREEKVITTDALGHDYVRINEDEPVCGVSLSRKYQCSKCNDVKTELYCNTHNYQIAETIAGTCVSPSKTVYKCSICSNTYTESGPAPAGHQWGAVTEKSDSVASACLIIQYRKCTVCGSETEFSRYYRHDTYTKILNEASCVSDGLMLVACHNCNITEEKTIQSSYNYHRWDAGTLSGNVRTYSCTAVGCGAAYTAIDAATSESVKLSSSDIKDANSVKLKNAELTFDTSAKETINNQDVTITSNLLNESEAELAVSKLSDTQTAVLGNDPLIYDFSVEGGGKNISEFNGSVTVKIPYELKSDSNVNNITVFYINGDKLEKIDACYNNGVVSFTTTHFSVYSVTEISEESYCEQYGHTFGESKQVFTPLSPEEEPYAECLRNEYLVSTCTVCGYTDTAVIRYTTGHSFYEEYSNEQQKATCTESCTKKEICRVCGYTVETVYPATGHKYNYNFVWDGEYGAYLEVKCENGGEYFCIHTDANEVGKSYSDTEEIISMCAEVEFEGNTFRLEKVLTRPHDHWYYTEPEVLAKPTCTKNGLTIRQCVCGKTGDEGVIPALRHDFDVTFSWSDDAKQCKAHLVCKNDSAHTYDIDCTVTNGSQNYLNEKRNFCREYWASVIYTESESGDVYEYGDRKVIEGAHEHFFERISYTAPTCTAKGVSEERCVCGETRKIEEDIIGHAYENFDINCSGNICTNWASGQKCRDCGYTEVFYCGSQCQFVSDGTSADGVARYKCTVCGATKTEKSPYTEEYDCFTYTKKSTALYDSNGKNIYDLMLIECTWHHDYEVLSSGWWNPEAICYGTYDNCKCKNCGAEDTIYKDVGHKYIEKTVYKNPDNCEEGWINEKLCTVCGYTEVVDSGLNHIVSDKEIKITNCECDAYINVVKCTVCNSLNIINLANNDYSLKCRWEVISGDDTSDEKIIYCGSHKTYFKTVKTYTAKSACEYTVHYSFTVYQKDNKILFSYEDDAVELRHNYTCTSTFANKETGCKDGGEIVEKCTLCGKTNTTNVDCHYYTLLRYELKDGAKVCTDGLICVEKCVFCGLERSYENSYYGDHLTYTVKHDLTQYGACSNNITNYYIHGGYLEIKRCACGKVQDVTNYVPCCYGNTETVKTYKDGKVHFGTEVSCSLCGIKIVTDETRTGSWCNLTHYVTYNIYNKTGKMVDSFSYQRTETWNHDYYIADASFINGVNCDNGCYVTYKCRHCDYSRSEESGGTHVIQTSYTFVNGADCSSGIKVQNKCVACGYVEEEHTEKGHIKKGTKLWILGSDGNYCNLYVIADYCELCSWESASTYTDCHYNGGFTEYEDENGVYHSTCNTHGVSIVDTKTVKTEDVGQKINVTTTHEWRFYDPDGKIMYIFDEEENTVSTVFKWTETR